MHTDCSNFPPKLLDKAINLITTKAKGPSITSSLTLDVDSYMRSVFYEIAGPASNKKDLVLLAVGGYGRREIAPFSDIDLMFLSKKEDYETSQNVQKILYSLWDRGINISHSYRIIDQAVSDASKDFTIRTSMLDARFVAGSFSVFDLYSNEVLPKLLFRERKNFIGEILSDIEKRHGAYDDSFYMLEPNIKDGIGGLRDIHSVFWLAKSALRIESLDELNKALGKRASINLTKAYEFLLRLRVCLHVISGSKNDIVDFDSHREAAEMLGIRNTARLLAPEIMMSMLYRRLKGVNETLHDVMGLSARKHFGYRLNFIVKKINNNFSLSKNELIANDMASLRNPENVFEAFKIYSATGKKFSRQLKEGLTSRALFFSKNMRFTRTTHSFFFDILTSKRVYQTLREMHNTYLLDRYIPEFGRLRNLVIYEPYHTHTVDEHTLLAIKNLEGLSFPFSEGAVFFKGFFPLQDQKLLYLAILLHDIGKGGAKHHDRHEEAGYVMLKQILERMPLAVHERKKVEFLVKHHILMARLAFSRDVDEPETVSQLSEAVENIDNLDSLYLMTYADMSAVNPQFFNKWKASLLNELYTKTKRFLTGEKRRSIIASNEGLEKFIALMPLKYLNSYDDASISKDYLLVAKLKEFSTSVSIEERSDGATCITVASKDRQGLLLSIIAALTYQGLNIISAKIFTGKEGIVVDKITVSNWKQLWWSGMEEQVKNNIIRFVHNKGETIQLNINKPAYRAVDYRYKKFIEIDNEASDETTILEFFVPDRIGLLHDISKVLYDCDVNIMSSIINTDGDIARDVFYLQSHMRKLDAEKVLTVLYKIKDVLYE
ncbi:MAG: [protein-PII] uridylyltransferase [Nitrospirae bacterium]|nr:[protein-PII] uridylyltransferase [Nitrospirota bacterium]